MYRERGGPVMSVLPRTCQNAEIPLTQVLQRTGTCLTQLSEKIIDLEHAIWGAQNQRGEPAVQANALQSLDFLKQATDDLAALLDRLGNSVSLSLTVSEFDVVAPIKLEALRKVVGTTESGPKTTDRLSKQQEVELF